MSDYEFPALPEIRDSFIKAIAALEAISPPQDPCDDVSSLPVFELWTEFRDTVKRAERTLEALIGPKISWRAPKCDKDWKLEVAIVDLNCGEIIHDDFSITDFDIEGIDEMWPGGPLPRAASAYRAECGWDFAPDETGVWLLCLAPTSASGGNDTEKWFRCGHLVGFLILHDRDNDGIYESVAHVWTARAWLRQGIASRLLDHAKRLGATKFERPFTTPGAALMDSICRQSSNEDNTEIA